MRNSNQTNSSQRRGQKNRKPGDKNTPRGGSGQRNASSNVSRNNSQQGTGGQRSSNRNKSRNEISQAWASDTSTLSSHMPTATRNNRNTQNHKTENKKTNDPRSRNNNRSGKNDRNTSRNPNARNSNGASARKNEHAKKDTDSRQSAGRIGNIDPFELFCAYHLGITKEKGYRNANINEVANRFRSEPGMIKQALKEYDMDSESLMDRDFDMALAQLDIQVAPEGVDRLELARGLYEEFQNAPRIKRDWNKIIEEDRKENQKIFRS